MAGTEQPIAVAAGSPFGPGLDVRNRDTRVRNDVAVCVSDASPNLSRVRLPERGRAAEECK